jgi:thymidylate synthase (FAD)
MLVVAGSNPALTTNQIEMKVQLINITPNAEKHIAEVARVSSSRSDKQSDYAGLINYLMKHKHWSPFEHAYVTFEIETSKAIGIQLIRHRSFTFQEFSQRYQDVNLLGDMFESIELRKQCENNRQSSTEIFSPKIELSGGAIEAEHLIQEHLLLSEKLYNRLISVGVAREQARMVLPMCTKTKIHMTGSIRSWIHFLDLRDDGHAQKEIQLIAREIRQHLSEHLPNVFNSTK